MILTQEVDFNSVPEDLQEECQSCAGKKVIDDGFGGQSECTECDGRGWTLCSVQDLLNEINTLRVIKDPPKKYHGWIIKKEEKDFNPEYIFSSTNTKYAEDRIRGYDLAKVLCAIEGRIGSFEIEENLGALGAFKVFTWEETSG